MTTRRGRRGSRSPYRRFHRLGNQVVPSSTTVTASIASPGSSDQQVHMRPRIQLLAVTNAQRNQGWFGLARLAEGATWVPELDDPRLLRPRPFLCSGQNDLLYDTFLSGITLDDEDELFIVVRNDGSSILTVYWNFWSFVDFKGS